MTGLAAIGIGHVTCDVVCPLQGWPEPDTKTIIPELTLAGGGPSANAMAALARLGVPCAIAGKLGCDVLGNFTWEQHARDGIDVSHLLRSPQSVSPVSIILSDLAASTRTILLTKGERTALAPEELDWPWLKQARVIHLDGHQMAASLAVARAARDWPWATVVLDAGSLRDGMLELCGLCDIVMASSRFARDLAGTADPAGALDQLCALGAPVAGITLGSAGCIARRQGQLIRQPAFRVEVLDTTGAGDAFHGGLIYGLLKEYSLDKCLQIACAVAALKCRGLGARQTLPAVEELQVFLRNPEQVD